jgi:hypothetical protein
MMNEETRFKILIIVFMILSALFAVMLLDSAAQWVGGWLCANFLRC